MEEWSQERSDWDEGKKKVKNLFSKRFIEYLNSKKLNTSSSLEKIHRSPSPTPSSDEESSLPDSFSKSPRQETRPRPEDKLKERLSYKSLGFNPIMRNKIVQCSLLMMAENVAPPAELKPLLINLTVLLQSLRQSSCGFGDICNQITKISILVTEFIRRPLKKLKDEKKTDYSRNLQQTSDKVLALLEEYKTGPGHDFDSEFREYKKMQREIAHKNQQIAELQAPEERPREDFKTKDLHERVRLSMLENERLKAEVKFNKSHVKKYKKLLLEKEWMKHKLGTELNHLRSKVSRADLCESENFDLKPNSPLPNFTSDGSQFKPSSAKFKGLKIKKRKDKMKMAYKSK